MRVRGPYNLCNRWYFKFTGNECSGPMTIEAVIYHYRQSGKDHNLHLQRSLQAYFENIPQGAVKMELWVGQCSGENLDDAATGWKSASLITIEEVSMPQS